MKHCLAFCVAFALGTLPVSAQEEWIEPLVQCGGVGLVLQNAYGEAADEGDQSAQLLAQQGGSLFFQTVRLMGEVTDCGTTYEETYQNMLEVGGFIQNEFTQALSNGSDVEDTHNALLGYLSQCVETLGFPTLMSAQARTAREGVGCGWLP